MQNNLTLGLRKFEVRIKEFVDAEDKAIRALKTFLDKVKELAEEEDSSSFEEIFKLRLEILKAFKIAMGLMSKAEHERSHLLDSYGSILLALEELVSTAKPKS